MRLPSKRKFFTPFKFWESPTDIERISHFYTASCNGVVSYEALIGGIRVFPDHTCRNNIKNISMIFHFANHAMFYACLSLHSDCSS